MKTPPKSLSEAILEQPGSPEEEIILQPLQDEIDTLMDPKIKSFVRSVLLKSDVFWVSPSSVIEKHHPPDEMAEGGMVLHTKRVARTVLLLTNTFDCSPAEHDCLLAAALLHDITKAIWRSEINGEIIHDRMHPYTVDSFIEWCRAEDRVESDASRPNSIEIPEDTLNMILRLIRCSHGVWSPIPETYPMMEMEKILHTADLVASHLHLLVDGMEVKTERWMLNET
jgi:hypothetical protein